MLTFRLLLRVSVLCVVLLVPAWASAQVIRSSHSLYGRLGVGTSVSETDAATYAVEPYSITGEIGYQMSHPFSLGLGATWADYPKANVRNTTMTTLQAVLRWTLFPHQPTTPYMQAGPQVTVGGDNPAGGVLFGLGIDHTLSRRATLFAEVTAYGTFPDDAIDSRDDGRASFDGLGFWGFGIRSNLRPAPTPPTIHGIEGPDHLFRDSTATFTIRLDDATSHPVRYSWALGDGTSGSGLVVDHTYALEGTYPITVTATNAAGRDTYTHTVTVNEPSVPARILALRSDTSVVRTGQSVRLRADVEGTAPLSLAWSFGDQSAPIAEENVHQYREGQFIGSLRQQVTQGHAFDQPGFYTVTLAAANDFGLDEHAVLMEVRPSDDRSIPAACREAPPPDTLFFDFDAATLRPNTTDQLSAHVARLMACPSVSIRLHGRADYVGSTAYNDTLSARRAEAVRDFYRAAGISADRIVHDGRGEVNAPCPPGARDQGCQTHRHVQSIFMAPEPAAIADEAPSPEAPSLWGLVVGSFRDDASAQTAAERLRQKLASGPSITVRPNPDHSFLRVILGPFGSLNAARAAQARWAEVIPTDAWLLQLSTTADIASVEP